MEAALPWACRLVGSMGPSRPAENLFALTLPAWSNSASSPRVKRAMPYVYWLMLWVAGEGGGDLTESQKRHALHVLADAVGSR